MKTQVNDKLLLWKKWKEGGSDIGVGHDGEADDACDGKGGSVESMSFY